MIKKYSWMNDETYATLVKFVENKDMVCTTIEQSNHVVYTPLLNTFADDGSFDEGYDIDYTGTMEVDRYGNKVFVKFFVMCDDGERMCIELVEYRIPVPINPNSN